MRATLTFELPEENEDLMLALKGLDYQVALSRVLIELRNTWKYSNDEKLAKYAEELRDFIYTETAYED